ncbi:MAG: cysteine--1-D-myo-inosityl 2-amino-2-deoxy-alpha-D-glucopyranoside ligase, partial [Propionibacteriaceae bacterium]|nr:cysteine--1-D-myo-inosityl 2-amino-2-deoxy-alpha-D-glucopyranoside ligase [Propionibacteriaceae bacterium]
LRRAGVNPMEIRLALLAHHYRSDWSWTDELLAAAQDRYQAWSRAAHLDTALAARDVVAAVRAAMADDLDAPRALAAIDAWVAGSLAGAGDDADAPATIVDLADALLGVRLS